MSGTAGTEDLPLHVHEFSDRLLVVTSGIGLFHYLPDVEKVRDLRSVMVEAGDAVLFTRGVVHTFTAPLEDLTPLSYHAPFFEFDDMRQFTILDTSRTIEWIWAMPWVIRRKSQGAVAHVASVPSVGNDQAIGFGARAYHNPESAASVDSYEPEQAGNSAS